MEQVAIDFVSPPARARHTDSAGSHASADRVTKSGRLAKQRARIFALVEATPGLTSKELAERHGEDRYMVAKRLPELRRKVLIRNGASKNGELTWWPTK